MTGLSLEELREVDEISYGLWTRCVTAEEQRDLPSLLALRDEIENNPYPVDPANPILKRMVEDGSGFDGYNAAMITLGYVRQLCLFYEISSIGHR